MGLEELTRDRLVQVCMEQAAKIGELDDAVNLAARKVLLMESKMLSSPGQIRMGQATTTPELMAALKATRELVGHSQAEMSRLLGVGQSRVSAYEGGVVRDVNLIMRYGRLLGAHFEVVYTPKEQG